MLFLVDSGAKMVVIRKQKRLSGERDFVVNITLFPGWTMMLLLFCEDDLIFSDGTSL